ncbi:OadG family protein [Klebsiella pneumoniae]|nr:OadG family protein [Klebsiella pneumoniae]
MTDNAVLLGEGFTLMCLGMGFVLVFLLLLIFLSHPGNVPRRQPPVFRAARRRPQTSAGRRSRPPTISLRLKPAIIAAIHHHRRLHP